MTFELAQEQVFETQEWHFAPGPRTARMHVCSPLAGINANTGCMLVLHNWGGIYNQEGYLHWCRLFADRFNVVAISVNYLQSGESEVTPGIPYDHGYLQAIDSLRALYEVHSQLDAAGVAFNRSRCFVMGVSGGGNVAQMCNKLAPHTFSCVVDITGMGAPGEAGLPDGYSTDPASPCYLSPDMKQIRDPGDPAHLQQQFAANPHNKLVIVHGLDDEAVPAWQKIGIFANMVAAGFRPDAHFLTTWHLGEGGVNTTRHPVGDRGRATCRFADAYLMEEGRLANKESRRLDFGRAEPIEYATANGKYLIHFDGPPTIEFISAG